MSEALDIRALDDLRRLGVAELDDCDVVDVRIDGAVWLAGFVVDEQEHIRRVGLGMGAATDRRLLHALWAMPEDVALDESSLPAAECETLGRLRKDLRPRCGTEMVYGLLVADAPSSRPTRSAVLEAPRRANSR